MQWEAAVKRTIRLLKRYRRVLYLLLWILIFIFALFYFRSFFSLTVDFGYTQLEKQNRNGVTVFVGKDSFGEILLSFEKTNAGNIRAIYDLPYNKPIVYQITMKEIPRSIPEGEPFYQTVISSGTGKILFEGRYQKGNPFLFDENGNSLYGNVDPLIPSENPYINFEPNLRRLMGIATGEYEGLRGNFAWLFAALLVILLFLAELKNPRFFWKLYPLLFGRSKRYFPLFKYLHILFRGLLLLIVFLLLQAALSYQ